MAKNSTQFKIEQTGSPSYSKILSCFSKKLNLYQKKRVKTANKKLRTAHKRHGQVRNSTINNSVVIKKKKEKAEISVIVNLNKRFNEIETLVATVEKQSSKSEKLMDKCELSLARIDQEL